MSYNCILLVYSHDHQSDYEGENTVVKDLTTFGMVVSPMETTFA